MKLTFNNPHKSITNFSKVTTLPDFTVLTGLNGSGKTHFLEALQGGQIVVERVAAGNSNQIRLFNWTTLVPKDSGAVNSQQIVQERNSIWNQLSNQINSHKSSLLNYARQSGLTEHLGEDLHKITSLTKDDLEKVIKDPTQAAQIYNNLQTNATNATNNVVNKFSRNNPNNQFLINTLKNKLDYSLIAIDEDDFADIFPMSWTPVDMFQQSFAKLFAAYEKMRVENEFKEFRNTSKGQQISFLTKDEFVRKHGKPPWEFVNEILEKSKLNFRVNQPDMYNDMPYEPLLTHQISGAKIKFGDLSSGEKILLSFALCVYYSVDNRQLVEYPKVLLFDEIDAPLHPSMTKSLIDVINGTLVEKHKIKVIITTHRPATVALSPKESIYVIENTPSSHVLVKSSKDKALSLLTTDTPSLSISYENRRQVFVESKYDARLYDHIYRKVKPQLHPEISLNFISTGVDGSGNCDQVKEVVSKLTTFGNKTIYGIIDWDLKNNGNQYVKILGVILPKDCTPEVKPL